MDDWGHVFTGRAEIKKWSDKQLIGARGVFTPEKISYRADAVTVTGDYRSDHVNGLNACTFRHNGQRLTSVTIRKGWRSPGFLTSILNTFRRS